MYKEVDKIKRKRAANRKKLELIACEQFIKAFFEIYTPQYIKGSTIQAALENKEIKFTIQYEFDMNPIADCEGFTIDKIDENYIIKCSHELRKILESHCLRDVKLYKRMKRKLNRHDFKFDFTETDSPWHEFNKDGKYKGVIELCCFKYYEEAPKWIKNI